MEPARRRLWILAVPFTVVLLGVLIWALLSRMPFGTPDTTLQPGSSGASGTAAAPETVAAGTESPGSVAQIGERTTPSSPRPTVSIPAPAPLAPATAPTTATRAPVSTNPPMASSAPMIGERDAIARLRDHIKSTSNVADECLEVRSRGFRNAGYTLDATDTCAAEPESSSLGRWRVDAVTREVFRRNESGKYVRP